MIAAPDIPFLPRGVRMHFDKVRKLDVLLGPERVVMLDAIGKDILSRLDGSRNLEVIASEMSARYDAPPEQVRADVADYLQDLVDKGFVHVR